MQRLGVRALVVATAIGLVALAYSPTPAGAAGTAITVTPSTNIVGGQSVSVDGTGFPPAHGIAMVQCVTGASDQNGCDLTTLAFATANAFGNIHGSVVTKSAVNTLSGYVDCSAASPGCIIGAADPNDIAGTFTNAPITFVAGPPPLAGSATLASAPLVTNSQTTISGAGWSPSAQITFEICQGDGTDLSTCVRADTTITDGFGSFTLSTWFPELLYYDNTPTPFDCTATANACSVVTYDPRDRAATFSAIPVSFEAPRDGTFAVAPAAPINDGDAFTVIGSGWQPFANVLVTMCATPVVCSTTQGYPQADALGDFSYNVAFPQWVDGSHACDEFGTVCSLYWGNALTFDGTNTIVVHYTPLPAPIVGTVDAPAPTSADQSSINVAVQGWSPHTFVIAALCAANDPAGPAANCSYQQSVQVDAQGDGNIDVYTPQLIGGSPAQIDCSVVGACDIAAWDGRDNSVVATTPMTVIPRPVGTMQVTPATGLHSGDTVTVTGQGWSPNSYIKVDQCLASNTVRCNYYYAYAQTDSDGSFSVQRALADTVPAAIGFWYTDCAAAPGVCALVASDPYSAAGATSAPLTFVADTVAVTTHYTTPEAATMHTAALQLGVTDDEYQHLATWATMYVLGISRSSTVGVAVDSGPTSVVTNYPLVEYRIVHATAVRYGQTDPEFQKVSAMALAYVLGL